MSRQIIKLRSKPATLSEEEVRKMLVEKDFFETKKNPGGRGLQKHRYRKTSPRNRIFFAQDSLTKLIWQEGGTPIRFSYDAIPKWLETLNQKKYTGSDWRLPTLEEAMSLVEPSKNMLGQYISGFFDQEQDIIWTADSPCSGHAWVVSYIAAYCMSVPLLDSFYRRMADDFTYMFHVRAVCSA